MRHQPPITAALALLAAAAATIPACSNAQHAADSADSSVSSQEAPQRTLEDGGVLTHAQVTRLFATDEGRRTLGALAAEHPHIYFDGANRFVQIGTTYSFAYGGSVPSLKLNNGWMHPDYAVSSNIMLVGTPRTPSSTSSSPPTPCWSTSSRPTPPPSPTRSPGPNRG